MNHRSRSKRSSTRFRKNSAPKRPWMLAAAAIFLVVDVFLVAWALDFIGPKPLSSAANVTPPAASTPLPLTNSSETPTPTATATPAAVEGAVAPTRLLSAVDANTAWRATTGSCPATKAAPEFTTDAGATWKQTDATTLAKVTALQSLVATNAATVELIGLAQSNCAPTFAKTFVSGTNYASYPDQLGSKWFIDPTDPAKIHSPTGSVAAPCAAVVALATAASRSAVALCATGQVMSTSDNAKTWAAAANLTGVAAVALTTTGYVAAALGRSGCKGVEIEQSTAGKTPTASGCFASALSPETLRNGLAISSAANTIWLWVADRIVRSNDGGKTWK